MNDTTTQADDEDDEDDEDEEDEEDDEDDEDDDEDDDYILASLLGEDDFEDDVLLEDEDVEAVAKADGAARGSGRPAAGDDAFDDDELAYLFGSVGMSRDGAVEASGMSPGDAGLPPRVGSGGAQHGAPVEGRTMRSSCRSE